MDFRTEQKAFETGEEYVEIGFMQIDIETRY